ncbi:SGNH/GDSL hydrolase family protein [Plantactinospora sp. B24E8]|uniref:SGNH/GDSL hydrolase family protein n=1 Tax=Plantactinospora sp. B24E8 TaxID=3153567 RepID=UPI00325D610D
MSGYYVALGDSMSTDDYAGGPGRGAASLLFRNRDTDFPGWQGRDLAGIGFEARLLARDGATTIDVLDRQLPAVDRPPTLVTISMGGNDLLAAYGDTDAARAAVARVGAQGEGVLTRLRAAAGGNCRIVLSTVYDPSDGTGVVPGSGLPPWPDGPAMLHLLNTTLAGLAERHGAALADVHDRFLGHGVTVGDPSRSDPRPPERELWYCGTVEPNAWGASGIRGAWWRALADLPDPPR